MTPSVAVPGRPFGPDWSDDFDEGSLDSTKWYPSDLPDVIYEKDGKLNFTVKIPPNGQSINSAELVAKLPEQCFTQVNFRVAADEGSGNRQGGVVLFVQQASGRVNGFGFGPNSAGGNPVAAPWICTKMDVGCGGSNNGFSQVGQFPLPANELTDVTIVQTGSGLEMRAGGMATPAPPDPTPIVRIWFRLQAAPTDSWTAFVDDLRLTKA